MTAMIQRRPSFVAAEEEEQDIFVRQVSPSPYGDVEYAPKIEANAQAPYQPENACEFSLTAMAEAEEASLQMDRRQMSIQEKEARGGVYTSTEPAAFAVDLPQNTHNLAGSAEAEEMAYAYDRQVSAGGLPPPKPAKHGDVELETPKAALARRCSHALAATAEAEEISWAFDRQVSAAGNPLMGA